MKVRARNEKPRKKQQEEQEQFHDNDDDSHAHDKPRHKHREREQSQQLPWDRSQQQQQQLFSFFTTHHLLPTMIKSILSSPHSLVTLLLSLLAITTQFGSIQASTLGGYESIPVDDAAVLEVAAFAEEVLLEGEVDESLASFVVGPLALASQPKFEIVDAAKQVVAGINYQLTMAFMDGESCLGAVSVVIYDQFGELSVVEWGELMSCDELDGDETTSLEGDSSSASDEMDDDGENDDLYDDDDAAENDDGEDDDDSEGEGA